MDTEEVPGTHTPSNRPIYWKEMSLLGKAWHILIEDWLPTILWVAFGLTMFYFGGYNG